MKRILLSLAMLSASTPVLAQQVELMAFGSARPDPDMRTEDLRPPPVELGVGEGALTDHFAAMAYAGAPQSGGTEPVEFIAPVSSIPVPQWLRTGRATMSAPIGVSPALSLAHAGAAACDASGYRPRGDLPISTELRRQQLYPLVAKVACEHGVPVGLFDALIVQESRYNHLAVSPKGARGLSQLMPGTARALGVNSYDPHDNLRGGARYLRQQLDEFGRADLALAAYNAGPGRVRRRLAVPQIRETQNYVRVITQAWAMTSRRTATIVSAAAAFQPAPRVGLRAAQLIR